MQNSQPGDPDKATSGPSAEASLAQDSQSTAKAACKESDAKPQPDQHLPAPHPDTSLHPTWTHNPLAPQPAQTTLTPRLASATGTSARELPQSKTLTTTHSASVFPAPIPIPDAAEETEHTLNQHVSAPKSNTQTGSNMPSAMHHKIGRAASFPVGGSFHQVYKNLPVTFQLHECLSKFLN